MRLVCGRLVKQTRSVSHEEGSKFMLNHRQPTRYMRSDRQLNRTLTGVLLALFLAGSALAQTPEQLLRGLFDAAKESRRPNATGGERRERTNAADMIGSPPPAAVAPPSVLWPTRNALLEAARNGSLIQLGQASEGDRRKVVASVQRILQAEYNVPAISRECFDNGGFPSDVAALLGDIGEVNAMTLSDQPPEFTNAGGNRSYYEESIASLVARLQNPRDPTHCDQRGMGRVIAHPYKAALVSLAQDYAKATQGFVEAERARRKAAYQEAMARRDQEERQRQAVSRAANQQRMQVEQQRLDAEHARIRAEEQRRAEKEKSRIGG
jgi:hypothetical protein